LLSDSGQIEVAPAMQDKSRNMNKVSSADLPQANLSFPARNKEQSAANQTPYHKAKDAFKIRRRKNGLDLSRPDLLALNKRLRNILFLSKTSQEQLNLHCSLENLNFLELFFLTNFLPLTVELEKMNFLPLK